MSETYKIIESLCKDKHMNVTEMCRESGIPRTTLSELKTGRIKNLGTKHCITIANYFGVSLECLTGRTPLPHLKSALDTNRLIRLRTNKNLLQKDVATQIGVGRTTYAKYETGDIQPPIDILVRIASIFETSTDYLLGLSRFSQLYSPCSSIAQCTSCLDTLNDITSDISDLITRITRNNNRTEVIL